MSQRKWIVNGFGDHNVVYSYEMQLWVTVTKSVVRPSGTVEVTGRTESGKKVTIKMPQGETQLVR